MLVGCWQKSPVLLLLWFHINLQGYSINQIHIYIFPNQVFTYKTNIYRTLNQHQTKISINLALLNIIQKYINKRFHLGLMSQDFKIEQLQLFTQLTTYVNIVPSFDNDEQIYLLSGEIKSFKANQYITVPLWFALHLKKQQKCKIDPPFWMKEIEENLQKLYNDQCTNSDLICLQDPEFFQISYIILNNAPDDVKNPTKVRNLVDSLRDVRQKIILKKLNLKGGFLINNVTTYELNKFRKSKNIIMKQYNQLSKSTEENK